MKLDRGLVRYLRFLVREHNKHLALPSDERWRRLRRRVRRLAYEAARTAIHGVAPEDWLLADVVFAHGFDAPVVLRHAEMLFRNEVSEADRLCEREAIELRRGVRALLPLWPEVEAIRAEVARVVARHRAILQMGEVTEIVEEEVAVFNRRPRGKQRRLRA